MMARWSKKVGKLRRAGAGETVLPQRTRGQRTPAPLLWPQPFASLWLPASFQNERLTDELNRRGIPAAHGGSWHRTSVGRVLRRLDELKKPGNGVKGLALKRPADVRAEALGPTNHKLREAGFVSIEAIARELNERAIPTAQGAKWHRTSVRRLLQPPEEAGAFLEPTNLTMAAMTWDSFLGAYSRPHLVVAWLHGRHRTGEERGLLLDDLKRAVMALKPRGDWAITNANPTEIYIAYDQLADATQFRRLVRAKSLSPSPQWHSQAAFRFEMQGQRSIMDLLKPSRELRRLPLDL